jgi:hypothetical protein
MCEESVRTGRKQNQLGPNRMAREIGFVIISHNQPQQLLRLVRRLQSLYDNPPIAVHHDFAQSPIRRDEFPSDVKFVCHTLKRDGGSFPL